MKRKATILIIAIAMICFTQTLVAERVSEYKASDAKPCTTQNPKQNPKPRRATNPQQHPQQLDNFIDQLTKAYQQGDHEKMGRLLKRANQFKNNQT